MKFLLLGLLLISSSCAMLLNLPDELSEDHYKTVAGDITSQNKKNLQSSPGARLMKENNELVKNMFTLPVVYAFDSTNTLKKDEEAYYTSKLNGYWFRTFAILANNHIYEELKARGIESSLLSNASLKANGATEVRLQSDRYNTKNQNFSAIAFNGESDETNLAETNFYKFRNFIIPPEEAVIFMMIQADWEPTSANRLNGDIVLNTGLTLAYEIVLCGPVSGCSTVTVPFSKPITTGMFMPNRNTIDKDGLDKNWELLQKIHGEQLKIIIAEAFKKFDQQGVFK